jgi:hypothetical protein
VWTGTPRKSGFFFHQSVAPSEICSALGYTYSDLLGLPAPVISRVNVCKIWYPNGVLQVLDTTTACADNEPHYAEVTCSTACGPNCLNCTTATNCVTCTNSQYLQLSSGRCVSSTSCGVGFYAPASSLTSGRVCNGMSILWHFRSPLIQSLNFICEFIVI